MRNETRAIGGNKSDLVVSNKGCYREECLEFHLLILMCFNKFVQVLAFNAAGDGPRSTAVTVRTLQGLPSAPRNITFTDITMNSLVVSWEPPYRRNGLIQAYLVTYETIEQDERETLLKLFCEQF